ncbi:MAG: hypothetical protein QOG34_1346, partial [Frankiaceae bacterium]|nr:hypothetical protein [Frankiaceae bacterium]
RALGRFEQAGDADEQPRPAHALGPPGPDERRSRGRATGPADERRRDDRKGFAIAEAGGKHDERYGDADRRSADGSPEAADPAHTLCVGRAKPTMCSRM